MANLLKQRKKKLQQRLKKRSMDFISAGVGCNALVAINEIGILKKFVDGSCFHLSELKTYKNPVCIKAALISLEKCGILSKKNDTFRMTDLGLKVAENIGLITIFFDGYGQLLANQSKIIEEKIVDAKKLVRWPVVSKSSIQISEKAVTPTLIKEFLALKFKGTICDLGCGHGVMLSKICQQIGNHGLGFERSPKTVHEAKTIVPSNVSIELADITLLKGIWEDVTFLIQAFVFHDFFSQKRCVNILNSYLNNFPNLRYFFYVDIVSPSESNTSFFPGFDYIHGLLNIPTRTYEETIQIFHQSEYVIAKEVKISELPNTYLWILSPKRKMKHGSTK